MCNKALAIQTCVVQGLAVFDVCAPSPLGPATLHEPCKPHVPGGDWNGQHGSRGGKMSHR